MARRAVCVILVLAGQLGLAAGFYRLGRIEVGQNTMTTCLGFTPGLPNPNTVTTLYTVGLPVPWAAGRHVRNEARGVDQRSLDVTNPAVSVAAAVFTAAFPPAVLILLLRSRNRWRSRAIRPVLPRGARVLWVAVASSVGGFAAAGYEAIAAGHMEPSSLVARLPLSPQEQMKVSQELVPLVRRLQHWRGGDAIARFYFYKPNAEAAWTVYTRVTAGGLLFGAAAGCLLFRPWRRAGGSSAPDGAAATTPPPA